MYIILIIATLMNHTHAMGLFGTTEKEQKFKRIESFEQPMIALPCIGIDQQLRENLFNCPKPEELFVKDNKWQTNFGWKSYDVSFTRKIDRFAGAQWQGVNIGRITCLYQSSESNNFPVQISTDSLIHKPNKPLWRKLPSGVYNCVSTNSSVCDCPFSYVKSKEKQTIDEIIQDLK